MVYFFAVSIALPTDYEDNYRKKLLRLVVFAGVAYLTIKTTFSTFKNWIITRSTIDSS